MYVHIIPRLPLFYDFVIANRKSFQLQNTGLKPQLAKSQATTTAVP